MAKPKGVSDHPAKTQMEELWAAGWRAKEITTWLKDNNLPVVSASTIARYGQRYWSNTTLTLEHTDLKDLTSQLEAIENLNIGVIKKVSLRETKNRTGETKYKTIEIAPNIAGQQIQKAAKPNLTITKINATKETKPQGWEVGIFLPDMQIGYHQDVASYTTTQDEAAINVAHQIISYIQNKYGVDRIINAGDNFDFAAISSHRSAPGFITTTQMSIDRGAAEAAAQRTLAPDAQIDWLCGNHECLDEKSRAITKEGPKYYHELSEGDLVLSATDSLEPVWLPIQATHTYDYDGPMVVLGNKNTQIQQMVTPNHRLVGLSPNNDKWVEKLAANYCTMKIPVATQAKDRPEAPYTDHEIRLAAWCLTDSYQTKHGYWRFYQSEEKVQIIKDILNECGITFSERCRQRKTNEICGKPLKSKPQLSYDLILGAEESRKVTKLVESKGVLPQWIEVLSDRQFGLFVKELQITDGTVLKTKAFPIYCSSDLRFELQTLLITRGYGCSMNEYRPGHWRLNVCPKKLVSKLETQYKSTQSYKGKVWCVTVQNGRFFMERNGHVSLTGNSRLINYLIDKAAPIVGLTRAGDTTPVISIPNLCRFDEYDINFIEPYPDSEIWVNDHLRFEHGSTYSSTPGGTAAKQLKNGVSVGYGHIHRQELLQETRHTARGPRTHFAGSPGTLCKIDGAVPSAKTGINSHGKQANKKHENWQQGLWVFWYQPEGKQLVSIEPISIWGGWALWRGIEFNATCTPDGEKL